MPTAVNAMQIYYGAPTVWQALFMLRSLPLPGNLSVGERGREREKHGDRDTQMKETETDITVQAKYREEY